MMIYNGHNYACVIYSLFYNIISDKIGMYVKNYDWKDNVLNCVPKRTQNS